jgi:DNA-binding NarL/FixJ family response regulator
MDTLNSHLSTKLPSPIRIFIVEDSPPVRDLIIENLTAIPGLEVIGYSDAESDAMDQLTKLPCDICILDIQLKQGNGLSLLRKLVTSAVQPNVLHIIFSNNVDATCRREGERYGVQFFFDKTTEFLQLQGLLQDLASDSLSS